LYEKKKKITDSEATLQIVNWHEQVLMKINQILDAVIAAEIFQIISRANADAPRQENGDPAV